MGSREWGVGIEVSKRSELNRSACKQQPLVSTPRSPAQKTNSKQRSPTPTPHSPLPIPIPIGTRSESSLHRELKFRYAGPNGQTEADLGNFVADGINAAGEIIEIQIGSFAPLKKKIQKLTAGDRLRIVYPVIITKYIDVFTKRGKLQYRRKSNKRGSPWDLFDALVYAAELPLTRRLTIELVLVDVVERRVQDGKGSWRRKGVSLKDRAMTALHDRICLEKRSDYRRFVPFAKDEPFTSALLKEKAGIRIALARKTLYVLTKIGVVRRIGKKGNALVYALAPLR